jgi:hypothetical protein
MADAIPAPPPPPPTSARADVSAQDVEMDGKNGEDGDTCRQALQFCQALLDCIALERIRVRSPAIPRRPPDKSVAEAMNDMNDSFAELLWRTTRDGRGPDADAFERDGWDGRSRRGWYGWRRRGQRSLLLRWLRQKSSTCRQALQFCQALLDSPAIPATPASAIPAPPPPPPTSARADVSAQDVEMDGKNGEDGIGCSTRRAGVPSRPTASGRLSAGPSRVVSYVQSVPPLHPLHSCRPSRRLELIHRLSPR